MQLLKSCARTQTWRVSLLTNETRDRNGEPILVRGLNERLPQFKLWKVKQAVNSLDDNGAVRRVGAGIYRRVC